ncbi:beta-class carbonic anhydrase [Bacillus solimangrovi]|uniref:carbonic anhydrase n=1 Tax=Bacillus solimangrovi TaxID=1305675 RepID=A0A1E5LFY1_9BACI|nr:carbonic anhydrase [Bacillus solimangrovi]OEH92981.1 carbonic anhydrase [Bacillus solimangrovi]
MSRLQDILSYNKQFIEEKKYEQYETSKLPDKKIVILSCMDTRLVELLPKAMNIGNGDVKMIKNAGAMITDSYGSIMRSILVAVYELQAEEVFVIGHYDCGMTGLHADKLLEKAKKGNFTDEKQKSLEGSGVDLKTWLKGFDSPEENVRHSVQQIHQHPLFPTDIPVHGLIIEPNTGRLDLVIDGDRK